MPTPARDFDVIAFGESMALFAADTPGELDAVSAYTRRLAGADSNVAIGLSRLGLSVDWTSRVGDDSFGRFIVAALAAEGVDCRHVIVDETRPTGFQLKARRDDGGDPEVEYFRRGSAASALSPADIPSARFARARHLHCTGIPPALGESARVLSRHAVAAMRAAGGTISFDPNLRPALWRDEATMRREVNALAAQADWVLPGLDEGRRLTGADTPAAIADFYLERGAAEVVIKLGPNGAFWKSADGECHAPGVAVARVVDTVGAGDGFAAGFISARLAGLAPAASLQRANAVGAAAVQVAGDMEGLPHLHELDP